MDLTLISALLRTLASVSTIASTGKKAEAVASTLTYAAKLVELGAEGEQKLKDLTAEVQTMVESSTPLTEDDFEGLKQRSDTAHATIQGA